MGTLSIWHWLIVLVVVLILFGGRGKISQIMGDFGKGLKSFKKSLKEDDASEDQSFAEEQPKALRSESAREAEPAKQKDRAAR
jgi:sec-independent protein translocase protein TatA